MTQLPSQSAISEKSQNTLEEIVARDGIPLPGHMLPLGQDGYRTPTIEDYHQHAAQTREQYRRGGPSNNGSRLRLPISGVFSGHTPNLSTASLSQGIPDRLGWKERLRHFTWTYFTMTMATGGIANVLYSVPYRFRGLETIGVLFFLFNVILFLINIILISLRFHYHPETFRASFLHPTERLYVPSAVVSFGTILINISQYGISKTGSWLDSAVLVMFWIDAALACIASSGIYLLMWSTKAFTINQMTPIWIFPAYPLLIVGPHAAILSARLPPHQAFDVIVGGFTIQGIGFLVAMMIYASFIYRLMTQKLPRESIRPGMFVSVGPSGFTAAGLIGMAANLHRALPQDLMGNSELVSTILKVVANWMSLWIWGLAWWFFFVSVGAHWSCVGDDRPAFAMSFYSFVFPQTALVTATFAVGKAFRSRPIEMVGCVLTPVLVLAWCLVFGMMVRAIFLRQILWPRKGEDRDEVGFRGPERRVGGGSRSGPA